MSSITSITSENNDPLQKKVQKKQNCELCGKKYGIFTQEHTCKRCLRSICSDCGSKKKIVIGYNIQPHLAHRVCDLCKEESDQQEQKRQDFALKWAQDSQLSRTWLESMQIKDTSKTIEKNFNQALQLSDEVKKSEAYQLYEQCFSRITTIKQRIANNYSFLEMFHYLTIQTSDADILNDVKSVIESFLSKHALDIGFSEDIIELTTFLLCYCHPSKAFYIICEVYEKIIPFYAYPVLIKQLGYQVQQQQINVLLEQMKQIFQYDQSSQQKISKFLMQEGIEYFTSMMVYKVNFTAAHYIFDSVIKNENNKYANLVKMIFSVLQINLEKILVSPDSLSLLRIILEKTQKIKIEQMASSFEINVQYPEKPDRPKKKNKDGHSFFESVQEDEKEKQVTIVEKKIEIQKDEKTQQQLQQSQQQCQQLQFELDKAKNKYESCQQLLNETRNELELKKKAFDTLTIDFNNLQNEKQLMSRDLQQTKNDLVLIQEQYNLLTEISQSSKNEGEKWQNQIKKLNDRNMKKGAQLLLLTAEIERLRGIFTVMQGDLDYWKQIATQEMQKNKLATITATESMTKSGMIQQELEKLKYTIFTLEKRNTELQHKLNQSDERVTSYEFKIREIQQIQQQQPMYAQSMGLADSHENNQQMIKLRTEIKRREIEYENLQRSYFELEKRFLAGCFRIMILSSECERLRIQIEDLQKEAEAHQQSTENYSPERKNSLLTASELSMVKVRLQQKEKELERTKEAMRAQEQAYQSTIKEIKEKYETVANNELKKISSKFQAEKEFFDKETRALRDRSAYLEVFEKQYNAQITEMERITLINQKQNERIVALESENVFLLKEIENGKNKLKELEKACEKRIEEVIDQMNKTSFQTSDFLQQKKQLEEQINALKKQVSFRDEKLENLQCRYLMLAIEKERLNQLCEEFADEIQIWNAEVKLQKNHLLDMNNILVEKNSAISHLQQELSSFQVIYEKNIKDAQEVTVKKVELDALETRLSEVTSQKKQLIEEQTKLRLQVEELQITLSNKSIELQRTLETKKKQEIEHQLAITQMKEDYEKVVEETVMNANQKMIRTKMEQQEKVSNQSERCQQLENELELKRMKVVELEEKTVSLQNELRKREDSIQELEKKCKALASDFDSKKKTLLDSGDKVTQLQIDLELKGKKILELESKHSLMKTEWEKSYRKVKEQEERIHTLTFDVDRRDKRIQEMQDRITSLEHDLESKSNNNLELEARRLQLTAENDKKQRYVLEMEQKVEQLTRDLDLKEQTLKEHEEFSQKFKNKDQYLETVQSSLKLQIETKERNIMEGDQKLQMLATELERLRRIIIEHEQAADSRSSELAKKEQSIAQLEDAVDVLKKDIKIKEERTIDAEEKCSKLTLQNLDYKQKLEQLQNQNSNKSGEIDQVVTSLNMEMQIKQINIKELESRLQALQINTEQKDMALSQLQTKLNIMESQKLIDDELNSQLKQKMESSVLDNLDNAQKELQEKYATVEQKVQSLTLLLDEKENAIKELQKKLLNQNE